MGLPYQSLCPCLGNGVHPLPGGRSLDLPEVARTGWLCLGQRGLVVQRATLRQLQEGAYTSLDMAALTARQKEKREF